MFSHFIVLVLSLTVLVKSADWLVESAARLSRRLGVSDLIIGLTITSIGTSVPELASSLSASLQGRSELAIGNIVGSNIANVGLILGAAAAFKPFATRRKMHDRDGFILLAASGLLFAFALDNEISRQEAGLFLLTYIAYLVFLARSDEEGVDVRFSNFIDFFFRLDYIRPNKTGALSPALREGGATDERSSRLKTFGDFVVILLAGIGVVASGHYLIKEAVWVAKLFSLPDDLIGLSLVAVGTSLPELTVAFSAARRGHGDMVAGNVIGSNIANTLLVTGLCGLVRPMPVPESSVVISIPIMLFFNLALLHLIKSEWRVTRMQGVLMLIAYVGFLLGTIIAGSAVSVHL